MPDIEELYLPASGVDATGLFALRLPNLRILQLYHNHEYPLEILAANDSLTRLEQLLCHPQAARLTQDEAHIRLEQLQAICRSPHLTSLTHLRLRLTDFGDEGAREIVQSGILKRLKVLDLRHGCMTDEGVRILAACPDLRNLEYLDLSRNALTEEGIGVLETGDVEFDATHQHDDVPDPDREGLPHYLYAGDCE